jgi:hypothetical protein
MPLIHLIPCMQPCRCRRQRAQTREWPLVKRHLPGEPGILSGLRVALKGKPKSTPISVRKMRNRGKLAAN